MRKYDVIVIGAGIIGLSLALELRKQGLSVLVVEKGEPGREASWAAGGMLADFPAEMPLALRDLASASAAMYPEFVHQLEDESKLKIDLRSQGTLLFLDSVEKHGAAYEVFNSASPLNANGPKWSELEPNLNASFLSANYDSGFYLKERSVDPRDLTDAAVAACRHRGVDFSSGDRALRVEFTNDKSSGLRTDKTSFSSGMVVNCAGAWAGKIAPFEFPTRPVKGQMLCVIQPQKEMVRHVIRTPAVYLIPRTDGRMLIGATAEEAGFDKRTVPETIQQLRRAALDIVPKLFEARFLDAWAGLRPGTPDRLPILGRTPIDGYFVATGHFRDGILLAPITARIMAQIMAGRAPSIKITDFSAQRFASNSQTAAS